MRPSIGSLRPASAEAISALADIELRTPPVSLRASLPRTVPYTGNVRQRTHKAAGLRPTGTAISQSVMPAAPWVRGRSSLDRDPRFPQRAWPPDGLNMERTVHTDGNRSTKPDHA